MRAETVAFAILGIVAIATVSVAIVWPSVPSEAKNEPRPAPQKLPMVRFTPGHH
jgi:hypothetical protein